MTAATGVGEWPAPTPPQPAPRFLSEPDFACADATPHIVGLANPADRCREDRRVSRHLTPFVDRCAPGT